MNDRSATAHRPRILHVTSTLDPGGIETWLGRLLSIPEGRPLLGGVAALSSREGLLAPQFREWGVPIHCVPPSENPVRFILDLARLLRRTGPWDAVHSHVYRRSALVHLASLLARIPLRVTHSHNTRGQETDSRNPLRGMLALGATWWINAISHLRIACSRDAAVSLFRRGVLDDPALLCMPCGMDVDGFMLASEPRVSRASLGIPDGATVVGHVGRFMPQKNHEFLLHVAAEAIRKNSRLHFLLVGDGPLRGDMEALAATLGIERNVSFTGNRLDVPSLMRHAMDCFFLPSQWEGLGIVALEAQALGLPCLLSDAVPVEANRLPHRNRVFPLSASPGEAAALLLALAESPMFSESEDSDPRQFIYSIQDNAHALEKAYNQALSGRARRGLISRSSEVPRSQLPLGEEAAPWK